MNFPVARRSLSRWSLGKTAIVRQSRGALATCDEYRGVPYRAEMHNSTTFEPLCADFARMRLNDNCS